MSENDVITYEVAKTALLSFLSNSGIKTIKIFQFDFMIMYFPFYMVINDLKKNNQIKIKFDHSMENDEKIIEEMEKEKFESFDANNKILHIGLCEPVVFNKKNEKEKEVYKDYQSLSNEKLQSLQQRLSNTCLGKKSNGGIGPFFMHLPFINFPPLYGVSLMNRPVINEIKRKKSREKTTKDEKTLSIIDYWRHFSAKMSLLDKNDFVELIASSYPRGSTTDYFVREKINFPLKSNTWVEDLGKEFDDLFNGIVDVAFTVQPWAAVAQSEFHNPPLDIDIVYKNVCTEFDCTSLIFKTREAVNLLLGDYILNCFHIMLKEKIKELYLMDAIKIEESIKEYCVLFVDACNKNNSCSCFCCLLKHKSSVCKNYNKVKSQKVGIKLEDGCLFENKMALRLTSDSQIYKHLKEIKKDHEGMKVEEVVAGYIVEKFKEDSDKLLSMF